MAKSTIPGSGPGNNLTDRLKDVFDQEEKRVLADMRVLQERLADIRKKRAAAFGGADKSVGMPVFIDPDLVSKERGAQVAVCLRRKDQVMTLDEITKYLRSAGALAGKSEAQGRNSVRLAVRYWSSTPADRRKNIIKREKNMGKPTHHDPQTLKVRGDIETGLIGLVEWSNNKFKV